MEQFFEPLCASSHVNGDDVITDLCTCVAQALRSQHDLLASDAYSSYSAKVSIQIQLQDLDQATVQKDVAIGVMDDGMSTETVEVAVSADADLVRERNELQHPDYTRDAPEPKPKRWYTPRTPRSTGTIK